MTLDHCSPRVSSIVLFFNLIAAVLSDPVSALVHSFVVA